MLSHVKTKYHRVCRAAEFVSLNHLNQREKAQVENLFMTGPWRATLHQPNATIQPGAIDTRVFNFTGRTLTQVHITGLRATVHNINIADYYGNKALRVRDDVAALTGFVPKLGSLQNRLVIVQRFNITGRSPDELNDMIMLSTFCDDIKQAMRLVSCKNTSLGGKSYYSLDGMFITYIEKSEFDFYEGVHEAVTGSFFTRVPLSLSQPHPNDCNPSLVCALDFEDEVLSSATSSCAIVYHDKPPAQLYYNDCGCVVPIPVTHDTARPEGLHKTLSFPAEKGKAATLRKLFVEPKDLTEQNGYFSTPQAALVMVRQEQMERHLELQSGILKGIRESGKPQERAIVDGFARLNSGFGEMWKYQRDHLAQEMEKVKKELGTVVSNLNAVVDTYAKLNTDRKLEHDRFMQQRKETLEAAKIFPAALSCIVAILTMTRKK